MVYELKKSECNAFMKYLGDSNFGDIPTGQMVKALAIIWSKTSRDAV